MKYFYIALFIVLFLFGCANSDPVQTEIATAVPETTLMSQTAESTQPADETIASTEASQPITEPTVTSVPMETTLPSETTEPAVTTAPTVTPPPPETTEPVVTTVPTETSHSDLYIPGVSTEDVITWFNEVCLDAEFVNAGNASLLQRWEEPIYYSIFGEPTEEDLATLKAFFNQLNSITGFPGILEAPAPEMCNLRIHFCPQSEFPNIMGPNFSDMDGAVTFWYDWQNRIYEAQICYRTDLDQYTRNSVLLEEIYNGLGPVQDTSLRSDSIIFSGFSTPQALTEVDWLLLKLLYHPQLNCGMNVSQCEDVIRTLYY